MNYFVNGKPVTPPRHWEKQIVLTVEEAAKLKADELEVMNKQSKLIRNWIEPPHMLN